MSWTDWLFPPRCVLCREPLTAGAEDGLCPDCRRQMEAERKRNLHRVLLYAEVICAAEYGGAMRSALLRVKESHAVAAVEPMGRLLCAAFDHQNTDFIPDAVTYVPSSALRVRSRGFTLSQEMARMVADHLGIPCIAALRHTALSARQAGQSSAAKRQEHAQASVSLCPGMDLTGQKLLLVDDILASGATLNTCAKLLRDGGAAEIVGLVLAKSSSRR